MTVDNAIKIFASFLNNSWNTISPLIRERSYTSNEDSLNDWLQANWEVLVERKILNLGKYLEVYGDGADFNGASSRITNIDALPHFRIIIKSTSSRKVYDILNENFIQVDGLVFYKFIKFENNFYKEEPFFDHVLAVDTFDVERVFFIDDIRFELEKIIS